MGAWSASVTGNDTAADLKDEYTCAFFRYPPEEALPSERHEPDRRAVHVFLGVNTEWSNPDSQFLAAMKSERGRGSQ